MNIEVNEIIIPNTGNNINKNKIEVSNIYPNNLIKNTLHASQRPLIAKLRSDSYGLICHSRIEDDYIKYAFNNFKHGYVYYQQGKPIAFCIWDIRKHMDISTLIKEDILNIYLICSKKLEYKLLPRILDDIVHHCRKHNIQSIRLQPANSKLRDYYINNGFIENPTFNIKYLYLDVSKARIFSKNSKNKCKTRKHLKT